MKIIILSIVLNYQLVNSLSLAKPKLQQTTSASAWCVTNTDGQVYNCPKTNICSSDYSFCPYVSATCPSANPFKCDDSTCVMKPSDECCDNGTLWCPHTNKCVTTEAACCTLDPTTPIYCLATQTCVSYNYECCSNFKTYTTENTMVKCSNENKCVSSNTAEFCFQPFNSDCQGVNSYQCPHDGKCVKDATQCAATRVCPTGYFMCPDYTCLPGLAQLPLCDALPTCTISTRLRGRCSDGLTCTENLQMCPTQVTCQDDYVLCPDNTCVSNQRECLQAPSDFPPKLSTCGPGAIRCPNGECQSSCDDVQNDCLSEQMIQCPGTFDCAMTYDDCPTSIYCPLVSNYTFNLKAILCQGPQLCTWDVNRCRNSYCQSEINYFTLSTASKPWPAYSSILLKTCPDGRCNSYGCMTQVSCSNLYPIKSQINGYFCTQTTDEADSIAEIAYRLQALVCPHNLVTCLSGHCRATIADCPQYVTCPTSSPIMCQDGQCVTSKSDCEIADITAHSAINICTAQSLLLCQSDLKTCVNSIELCPTTSTCPFGYNKCLENKCVLDWECTDDATSCTDLLPLYCRSLDTCVASMNDCPSLTICPPETPVKCASDQSCQSSFQLCPAIQSTYITVLYQEVATEVEEVPCAYPRFFECLNGECSVECDEWVPCPEGQVQCFNGRCMSDIALCPNSTNNCPFNLPEWCPYQARCVKDSAKCTLAGKAAYFLNQTCQSTYGSTYNGCPLGNCLVATGTLTQVQSCAAANSSVFEETCALWAFPNDIPYPRMCYNWNCPQQVPYKCPDGLCVADINHCPFIEYSAYQINNCTAFSAETGYDLRYPCGDNNCVSSPDQCKPLYNCTYNFNGLDNRCNDGTCKANRIECSIRAYPGCTYRCQSGECVDESTQCQTENGCTIALPYRCEYNGVCMLTSSDCWSTTDLIESTSLQSSTPALNICQARGLVTCVTDQMMMYCSTNLSMCYSVTSGCPQTAPILCGGWCVNSISTCAKVSEPAINNQGCSDTKPFRCSKLWAASCAELPYSSSEALYPDTCTALTQNLVGKFPINKCSSSLMPYSCADGSCTAELGGCPACPYWCLQLMGCTATSDECTSFGVLKSAGTAAVYQQTCPIGSPIRCVVTGNCVQDPSQCLTLQSMSYDGTYTGQLLDPTCPSDLPIRCINGNCTNEYIQCQATVDMDSEQMVSPIAWGSSETPTQTCQVYCADGSCRDRQENCPLTQACFSPQKPFRCMNGLCAKDLASCISLFGTEESEKRGSESAYCINKFGLDSSAIFFKCEDGTCRPATYNTTTKLYATSCLQYMGCPLTKGYQCPTGQCVTQLSDCLAYRNTLLCDESHYMCKNMACVSDPAICNTDLSSLQVLQLQVELSPWKETWLNFTYNGTLPVLGLYIPSGSVPLSDGNLSLSFDAQAKLRINPVPTQRLYKTVINDDALDYASERYTLTNQQLTGYATLLLPMFEISTTVELQTNATLYFKVDLPSSLDLESDVCLASLSESQETWECVTRKMVSYDDGWISVEFNTTGQLAFIFSPDMSLKTYPIPSLVPTPTDKPDPEPDETVPVEEEPVTEVAEICDTIWCDYKWWIIGGSCGLLVLILLVVGLCCWWRTSQEQKKLEAQRMYEKNVATSQSIHNENLVTEQSVVSRIQKEKDEAVRLVQKDFKKQLKLKDSRILELESSVKEISQYSPSKISALERPEFGYELRAAEDRIKEHYRSEVVRVAEKMQREFETQGRSRNFQSKDPKTRLKDYPSDGTYDQMNWPKTQKPQKTTPNEKLSDQWNKLVYDYKPADELLSSTSRPLLMTSSDLAKSSKSQERVDKRKFVTENVDREEKLITDDEYNPRSRKLYETNEQSTYRRRQKREGPSSQSTGIRRGYGPSSQSTGVKRKL